MMDRDFVELVNTGVKHSTDNWGCGVILQHPQTKKILLARRTDTHTWASPGGKVEYQESPKQGVLRECKEESNVTIHNMSCYDYRVHTAPNGKNWVDFLFYSDSFDDSDVKPQATEMEPFEWFTVDEALQLDMFEPTKRALLSAIALGLLDGTCDEENYIPFVDCPSTPSAAQDSCHCAYSFVEPETVFANNQGLYWD